MSICYRIASPQITSEILDEEVMIINLKNGHYFNISGSGAEIWQLLQQGCSIDQILSKLSQCYRGTPTTFQSHLDDFLKSLQREELIATFTDSPKTIDFSTPSLLVSQKDFVPPVLSKYSDMQELLLLDPIHDVDDAGWPQAKTN